MISDIFNISELEADTGYDRNFEKEMKKNIDAGKAVFDCLLKQTGNMTKIGGHGDMYIAFLHTKISSNIIRSRAERIGSGASVFSVDAFLSSLVWSKLKLKYAICCIQYT